MRFAADLLCVLLVIAGHVIALPAFAWRCWQAHRSGDWKRVERAALLWDLTIATLLGAQPGETVSTWAARVRPARWACALCRLLSVRWPSHCEDSAGVYFDLVRRRETPRQQ